MQGVFSVYTGYLGYNLYIILYILLSVVSSHIYAADDDVTPVRFPPRVIEDREGCYPDDSREARNEVSNDVREIVRSYEERDGGSSMGSPMP